MDVYEACERVREAIGDPTGQCYPAAEAVYHLAGGKVARLTPMVAKYAQGEKSHWWLETYDGAIIDPTEAQYPQFFPYEQGRGCGFLTKEPSKRARAIMEKVDG